MLIIQDLNILNERKQVILLVNIYGKLLKANLLEKSYSEFISELALFSLKIKFSL